MSSSPVAHAEILNPRLKGEKEALAQEFQTADPFPHVAIRDFFSPEFCQRLLDEFPTFEDRYATGEMGEVGRKAARKNVREISDAYREVDDFIQSPEFLGFMSEITGIPDLMYDVEYHGGGTHENLDGQGLYTHVDFNYHPKGWHRRLNLIVYFNPEWQEEWGGSLELRSNPWDPETDSAKGIPPLLNVGVIFETSEHSWHGFSRIKLPEDRKHLSRKSFAIYLYTKDRPAEQTSASHSTIYIPEGMPGDLQPGSTLTEEQYRLLNARFNEYRNMLKLQYERQQRMSEEFSEWYRIDLQGYAVQTRAPIGIFTDGWASSEFSSEFSPTAPVRKLHLEIEVPADLGSDQVLEIQAGDWSGTEVLSPGEHRTLELPVSLESEQTVELTIKASTTWVPGGGDTRELSYRIVNAALEH